MRVRLIPSFPGFLLLILLLALLLCPRGAIVAGTGEENAPENGDPKGIQISEWLLLGPIPSPLPAFHAEGKKKMDAAFLLSKPHLAIEDMTPIAGGRVSLIGGKTAVWNRAPADTAGVLLPADTLMPQIAYLAVYIEAGRWLEMEVTASGNHPFEITVDGASAVKSAKRAPAGKSETGTAKIKRGTHLVLVKTVCMPADTLSAWNIDVRISPGEKYTGEIAQGISPERKLSIEHILDPPRASGARISPDGTLIAVKMGKFIRPEGGRERWLEIRRFKDGSLVRTIRDIKELSDVQWAPTGNRLSYKTSEKGVSAIRVADLDTGGIETIVGGMKELGGYDWSPDGTYIIYSVTEKPEPDKTGVKHLHDLEDRLAYARRRSYLHVASVPRGVTRRITAGKYSSYLDDIHPDGRTLLVTRHIEDLSERPYGKGELVRMDLESGKTELYLTAPWMEGAMWSPDGKEILVLAGPSTFGDAGKNVPEGVVPNDYDTQAYIFDPATKDIDPITKTFAPSITGAHWSRADGDIYFIAEEGEFVRLYRYDPGKRTFKRLDLGFEVIERGGSFALGAARAALVASSAGHPTRLYAVDLGRGRAREIFDPGADMFRHVRLGTVEKWSFTSSGGTEIDGRVHYPPDFDPDGTYPCIVYYYGGTSTVNRSFGGRYPKNLWAAGGYIVYVIQPSGATGYGQEFSARHVNDWGKIVADEIIEGTGKFLDAHPFVDPGRVGCIGASFGGFMTQLLVTKTDIFAAAVSHAGISSIASYWGEGYWGYGYSAVATAESFPWNRRDIYVDRSPLFAADRVNTPLLLLHGAEDTNVPRGESDQMFIALKLLGKPVEYIRFAGQNHFILDYKKRKAWNDAIISWFDRWLKDEPEWWLDMYPPSEEQSAGEPGDIELFASELEGWGMVLLGKITRETIVEHIPHWDEEYFDYSPDATLIPELQQHMKGISFRIVLGTWCSDSQREVPRLWKILDEIGLPESDVTAYAVGSSRFTVEMPIPPEVLDWSTELKEHYGIELVATIIVERFGREIGRIVETPEESLEKDLVRILLR